MIVRGVGLALVLVLSASPVLAGHGTSLLDARRPAPAGINLELAELPPDRNGTMVLYRLRATGVPRDVTFDVWAKDFREPFREIASGFQMDERGILVSTEIDGGGPKRLDTIAFGPGPYPRGAVWEIALVSMDRTIRVFTKVIPRPIVATDGPCSVSLELVSHRGERFLVSSSGFVPGEDVIIESRSSGRVSTRQDRASADGLLPRDLISHAAPGSDRRARYSVKGRSCEVALNYEWGEPALELR